jgi:hypothetical protein
MADKWVNKRTGKTYSTTQVVSYVVVGVGCMIALAGFVLVVIAFLLSK